MFKGMFGTILAYMIFIILPFVYLLMSLYTLMTNQTKLAINDEAPKSGVTQIYRA